MAPQEPPRGPNSSPLEARNHTKMLFEIACRNFFRDHSRPDARNAIGSVAGFGGACPTGDPATEPSGSRGGGERSDVRITRILSMTTPNVYRR